MKQSVKDRILRLAREKFMKHGFHKVSLDALVAELHTSKSSLYNHFKSKEDLVYQVLLEVNHEINTKLENIMYDKKLSFYGKLMAVMEFTANLLKDSGDEFLHDLKLYTPDLWQKYMNMRKERINRYYKQLFETGLEEGIIREDLDPVLVLNVYFKLTEITVNPAEFKELELTSQETYHQISSLFLEGIKKQD
jgi:AcrR family transcriptional regulator